MNEVLTDSASEWLLGQRRPRDSFVYYEGELSSDGRTSAADRMWKAALDGTVDLVQRRISYRRFEYIAIWRSKPHDPPILDVENTAHLEILDKEAMHRKKAVVGC